MSAMLLILVIFGYACCSLIVPCNINRFFKAIWSLFFAICTFKFLIYADTGTLTYPHFRPAQVLLIEMLFNTLLLCVVMAIIKDLILLILYILNKLEVIKIRRFYQELPNIAICIVAVTIAMVGTFSQTQTPKLKEQEIYLTHLPQEFDGYKIVQISDLHMGPVLRRYFLNNIITRINGVNPDLIALTGDYADGLFDVRKDDFDPLAMMFSKDGMLAVTGEHDYFVDYSEWEHYFKELGITFLRNESVILKRGHHSLKITGIPDSYGYEHELDDPPRLLLANFNIIDYNYKPERVTFGQTQANSYINNGLFDYDMLMINLKKINQCVNEAWLTSFYDRQHRRISLNKHESSFTDVQILLSHKPAIANNPDVTADLILSGHTHGGVTIFLQPLFAYFNGGYVSGLYQVDEDTQLYVSNGTGIWSAFSCRILVPSEITLITLRTGTPPTKQNRFLVKHSTSAGSTTASTNMRQAH